ncbi:isovaleryl-CoA dehydrogenase [Pseudoduganella sp. LjRoot289]|uniref:isovaleryl-CoA dehydrogenase n=1 Tax=Pseudoduganella sp. LjRoot289 TaxID=3342314 RepID=UPI003ECCE951
MQWETHEVGNQAAELKDYNLFLSDPLLRDAVQRGGAGWHADALAAQGALLGSEAVIRMGELANRHPPELRTHSRTGERIDVVEFHPAWHGFLDLTRRHGLVSLPFTEQRPGAWTAYAASQYMHNQIEAGSFCPVSMTFACIPLLQQEPALFAQLQPLLFSREHDPRDLPAAAKKSIMIGMGMTEKQGGTDVRSNTTRATPLLAGGRGGEYSLVGHKWFFSAPMCDAHMVLARTDAGLSCFYVPRWRPDGSKNPIHIQRLKDKLGNRSNSSSEVEFHGAWGVMVGEEGRGIPTIIEMATNTRLHNSIASAGLMRQALVQALNHTRQRQAFGRKLIDQPLMRSVLADMALESEAALRVSMRLAEAFGQQDDVAQAWKRIVTPAAKFWICKRAVEMMGEAMEVFGGNGYVEEGPMARLFREAPVNSIWEGSGNVMCLDVLRAIARHPDSMQILLDDLQARAGDEARLHSGIAGLRDALRQPAEQLEADARRITQKLMLAAQAVLMRGSASSVCADAFLASRYDGEWGRVFGALGPKADCGAILAEAWSA